MANRETDTVSSSENRVVSSRPLVYTEDLKLLIARGLANRRRGKKKKSKEKQKSNEIAQTR